MSFRSMIGTGAIVSTIYCSLLHIKHSPTTSNVKTLKCTVQFMRGCIVYCKSSAIMTAQVHYFNNIRQVTDRL